MSASRRDFLRNGGGAATAGAVAVLSGHRAVAAEGEAEAKPMVAACGLACSACPLLKAGKCKGCGPAKAKCPVFSCAKMKGIAHCGTECGKFTECGKLIGRPYSKEFMERIKSRLG